MHTLSGGEVQGRKQQQFQRGDGYELTIGQEINANCLLKERRWIKLDFTEIQGAVSCHLNQALI